MKYLFKVGLALMSLPTFADHSHQISTGYGEFLTSNQNFKGSEYRFFTKKIDNTKTAYSLQPYRQRIDNFSVSTYETANLRLLKLDGEFYFDNHWTLNFDTSLIRDESYYYDNEGVLLSTQLGRFVRSDLQLGASVIWSRTKSTLLSGASKAEIEMAVSPFFRYTPLRNGVGWDLMLQKITADRDFWQVSAQHYFNKGWNIGVAASVEENEMEKSEVELQSEYWINPHFSVKLGYGRVINSDENMENESVTFVLAGRF